MKKARLFQRGTLPAAALGMVTAVLLIFASGNLFAQTETLVWSDEFDYNGQPDPDKWNIENWPPGVVNDELQAYTDRPENVQVENGHLIIEARRDHWEGNEYTSARIQSAYKGDILYGRIEAKAILPEGRGTWPAIWMLPTDWVYGDWPTCGEIDIMEHVGYDPGVVHASVHTETYNHTIGTQITATKDVPDFNTAYHVYALEWTPDEIRMYVDDVQYFTFLNEGTGFREWPFDKPFHIILNLAVGGTWGGAHGVAKNIWPQQLVVDYVKMYSYDFGPDGEPPTAPTNLAGNPSSSSITLTWDPSTDNYAVKEYEVYLVDPVSGDRSQGTTIYHEYVVGGLNPLTTYTLKVTAKDYSDNESPPASVELTTIDVVSHPIPGKVEAEEYDAQFGTQTEATTDEGGGVNIGWIDAGDWLEYVVESPAAGEFIVDYRVASQSEGGGFQLVDESGTPLSYVSTVPVTGDWQAWETISSNTISLPAGLSRLKINVTQGGWNLNWLEFRSVDPTIDNEPPSAPPNLSAVMTTTTADLSWDASGDNVAVAGYHVYQDGGYVDSISGLNYLVEGLSKRTGYTFEVSAYDAAGNESAMSRIRKS
ncbi:MAG: family 16 glycosylhydrolase [Deltaproteobacteria bacterium]